MQNTIFLKTNIFDLDWNRHVTSRTYEKFSLEGRHSLLNEIGYPIQKCIEEKLLLIPEFTQVRFLAQQFAGANLKVQTQVASNQEGKILWTHKIFGKDEALACELTNITRISSQDTTCFFMGGKIQFFRLPLSGEKVKRINCER